MTDLMRVPRGIQAKKNNRIVSWFKRLTVVRILRMRLKP